MNTRLIAVAMVLVSALLNSAVATEPNNTFGQATLLGDGVLSVTDDVTPGTVSFPDTMLGVRDMFGGVYYVDDDGSPIGDGRASGIGNVPTNSGSISFVVSGYPDDFFEGNHGESGQYEVFIDVYDFFGDHVDSFSEISTLEPGIVDEYSFSDFEWIEGFYDVYIDNTLGGSSPSDVDFFTFTGLSAGATFSAEVTQEASTSFDSYLGWFSDAGVLLDTDDNSGVGNLSLLEGTVPASGKLTFAVTGVGDGNFAGDHSEDATYMLELSLGADAAPGDFDNDGDVDGRDFLVWQRGNSPAPLSASDLADWQANYGGPTMTMQSIPEPGTISLILFALAAWCRTRLND